MVDFSRLRSMTPEEKQELLQRSERNAILAEQKERDSFSKKAISVTLAHEPEVRGLPTGERAILFKGFQEGQTNPVAISYVVPSYIENDDKASVDFDRKMREMGGGDVLSFAGQWSARKWRDQNNEERKSWEFKSQYFADGKLGLDQVLELNRYEKSGSDVSVSGSEKDPVRKVNPASIQTNSGIGV